MQVILQIEECGDFVRYLPVQSLNNEIQLEAEMRFKGYIQKGIIIDGTFGDIRWRLTNQLRQFTLDFHINEFLYRRKAEAWTGCTMKCFQECMKAFSIFQLGSYSIQYLQSTVKSLRMLAEMNMEEAMNFNPDERHQLIMFLKLIPESNDMRDRVIETLEEMSWNVRGKKPRQLT